MTASFEGRRAAGWLALIALLVLLPFVLGDYYSQLATEVLIFAIFAMSLDLLLGYTGLTSFGHSAFFGVGAYAVVILATAFDVDPWVGMVVGVAAAALAAAVIGAFCIRVSGIPFLMLTMAFSQLIFSVAVRWRDVTGGTDGLGGLTRPTLFGLSLDDSWTMYGVAAAAFLAVAFTLHRLIGAPLGRAFIGIRENEARMRVLGYRVYWYKLLAFTISGAFAGLAGGLYAIFNNFVSPDTLYWSASGDVLIMVVIGGVGTLFGPAIGAGLFLLLKYFISSHSDHWIAIVGILFISCVLFFPRGIYGLFASAARSRS